ncbi:MAG: bifunctional fucokinase/L-fucose-1-P-guanylyltransferase [Bacteroidaceae bacterium]|jgi:galactokinase/mevalonate kinase-like predicted kinase|nr:bifunctional fucokinase/L-fucose-1-P-guanylyltransferase [Bacteroidaceae bacterium]
MKKLLSLPPNLVDCFFDITGVDSNEWFCTNDPVGRKLGSGGGSTWLLQACYDSWNKGETFDEWLSSDKKILLHAGGQSRRLPAYAPSGKVLTPIPVFRWERGQRLSQNLLSIQMPLYEQIIKQAPDNIHTMIVSGDVYVRNTQPLQPLPDADVICYGLWIGPEVAKNHGVFVSNRNSPNELEFMLQKPSVKCLGELMQDHLYLFDIGVWLLSDRAVKLLMKRSLSGDNIINYDLYSEFGCTLGSNPKIKDDELNELKVAILPLPGGEFYHYGTTREILSSTLAVQNLVNDQRVIMHHKAKPHPSIFIQNSICKAHLTEANPNLWIENSCIGQHWTLSSNNVITGVPDNDWQVTMIEGECIDVVPVGDSDYVIRPYGFNDKFRGDLNDDTVTFMGIPFCEWAFRREIAINDVRENNDLQSAKIFPIVRNKFEMETLLRWMTTEPELKEGRALWLKADKLSADDISAIANLRRLHEQRKAFRAINWPEIAANYEKSVFYQLDLDDAAREFHQFKLPIPSPISESASLMQRIHDSLFRSEVKRLNGEEYKNDEQKSFELLRDGLTSTVLQEKQSPRMSVYADQIVWGRSPVRIDLAGGWTDTPPFCLMEGGNVINLAIELNGQPPLQAFVKPCNEPHIIIRSIDLGASEIIKTYQELADFTHVGSPFSIPKAALVLAGFQPGYSSECYTSLEQQLRAFGCGVELTLLSAIPAGSGLGTSSVLASTVLGAVSDFCGLAWDKNEIGKRTLVLEQLLTTGGGWQDQFGGILPGVKLLQTIPGFCQDPVVRWLPDSMFVQPEYQCCHLLYYTGITRTAKKLLAEIVRKMFLNSSGQLSLLRDMKQHTLDMYEAIQRENFGEMGRLIGTTWTQNQLLDSGTNPAEVKRITDLIDDLCLGYKLPGAGGGGYLYMVAKDAEAAVRIKQILNANRQNSCARFVDMTLSKKGMQVSRS